MNTIPPVAAVRVCLQVAGIAVALILSGNSFEGGNLDRCSNQPLRQFSTPTPRTIEPEARSKTPSLKKRRPREHGRLAFKAIPAA
jgi:hypothetical protein